MGLIGSLFYPWGLLLQIAAIVHFIRRRPDIYWIFIIVFLGPLGALIYLFVEVLPDLGLLRQSFKRFPRRKRISQLLIEIHDNPSVGNFEELGDLYMDEGKLQAARDAYNRAIAAHSDTLDCFYRRGVCALLLGDATGALPDLEMTVQKEPDHDFYRGAGLLAHAYAQTGQKAESRSDVPPGAGAIDALRNLFEFRRFPRLGRPHRRSPPLGAESARQEADHARLPAPPRTALVSPRQRGP